MPTAVVVGKLHMGKLSSITQGCFNINFLGNTECYFCNCPIYISPQILLTCETVDLLVTTTSGYY